MYREYDAWLRTHKLISKISSCFLIPTCSPSLSWRIKKDFSYLRADDSYRLNVYGHVAAVEQVNVRLMFHFIFKTVRSHHIYNITFFQRTQLAGSFIDIYYSQYTAFALNIVVCDALPFRYI